MNWTLYRSKFYQKKVKLFLCSIKHYAMKVYGGVDVQINVFFSSAVAGGDWSASRPGRFTPGEKSSGTHRIGGRVGPRIALDDVERRIISPLPALELRPLVLYRPRCPGS
jgi:hypothetical protein